MTAMKSKTNSAVDARGANQCAAVRVVMVEDDASLRRTMIEFIKRAPGFTCVGDFADGETALLGIPVLMPELVLMDIGLPGMSGIQCMSALKVIMPDVPFIMLTVYDEGDFLFDSLKAGASGYLLKRAIGDRLVQSMQEALVGGLPLTSHMAAKVGEYFREQRRFDSKIKELTSREQEVLTLLAEGLPYKNIADDLDITLDGVRNHIKKIYEKLHVHSKVEAVNKYLGR
jgi:DNA-binding NarL/FixJ family response regulator